MWEYEAKHLYAEISAWIGLVAKKSFGSKLNFVFQVSSISGNGSSNSPLISKEPTPRSGESEDNETEDELGTVDGGAGDGSTPENEMEYCDPCVCYGKCCLDVVASIFCVSLL